MEYNYQGWGFIIDELKSKQYYSKMPVIFDSIIDYLPELCRYYYQIDAIAATEYIYVYRDM